MKEYTPEYLDKIRDIIALKDDEAARAELATMHPADIAELYQDLDLDEAEFLYQLLDDETAADVLIELDEDDRKKLLSHLQADEIADADELGRDASRVLRGRDELGREGRVDLGHGVTVADRHLGKGAEAVERRN